MEQETTNVAQSTTDSTHTTDVVHQTTTAPEYTSGYVAVVPMTFEEKYKMYMRCSKKELARMLAARDYYEDLARPAYPVYPQYPYYPYPYYYPVITCDVNGDVKLPEQATFDLNSIEGLNQTTSVSTADAHNGRSVTYTSSSTCAQNKA